jgi:hypothetical protein
MKRLLICSIIALSGFLSVEARAESPHLGQTHDLISQSIDSGDNGSAFILEINALEPCTLDIAAQQFRLVAYNLPVVIETPISIVVPLDQGNSSPPESSRETPTTNTFKDQFEKPAEYRLNLRTIQISYLGGNSTAFRWGDSCQSNHNKRHNSEHWSPPMA